MSTISRIVTIESESCVVCGTTFGLESRYMQHRLETGENFYCPNGHSLSYNESEVKKLQAHLRGHQAPQRGEASGRGGGVSVAVMGRLGLEVRG